MLNKDLDLDTLRHMTISVAVIQGKPLGAFYTCFYNHAHRLRLEKLL
jgi:hypothetical protein